MWKRCSRCSSGTSSGRLIGRHTVDEHDSEWRGPNRPICPVTPEWIPQARRWRGAWAWTADNVDVSERERQKRSTGRNTVSDLCLVARTQPRIDTDTYKYVSKLNSETLLPAAAVYMWVIRQVNCSSKLKWRRFIVYLAYSQFPNCERQESSKRRSCSEWVVA